MPVPDYETLMLPVLKLFGQGAENVGECLPSIKAQYAITDEEAEELIPSGRVSLLSSRTHWARTYLSKAGLLESPKRNQHQITELGRAILAENPALINNAYLKRFDNFNDWVARSRDTSDAISDTQASASPSSSSITTRPNATPEDALAEASAVLDAALRDELIELLQNVTPVRFERIILDLLNGMGYGGGRLSSSQLTKAGADGGIDGVISEDALGLDAVYIQAKRYAVGNNIGRPHIQQFVGSLTGESANKGVFVTTSDFSKDALDYAQKVQQRIVLINGGRLARLMIEHGVGVRTRTNYAIKTVDEDFFSEMTG